MNLVCGTSSSPADFLCIGQGCFIFFNPFNVIEKLEGVDFLEDLQAVRPTLPPNPSLVYAL